MLERNGPAVEPGAGQMGSVGYGGDPVSGGTSEYPLQAVNRGHPNGAFGAGISDC
jgi:hypothetical protein